LSELKRNKQFRKAPHTKAKAMLRSYLPARQKQIEAVPRLLSKAAAAEYCSLSPSSFGKWVRDGRLPKSIPETHRWDRLAIDSALDRVSGIASASTVSALDEWRSTRNALDA